MIMNEKLKSIWEKNNELKFEILAEDIECEILIIGGGIAGILTAYYLKESGQNVVLVEAEKILEGVTANTTATITSQHGLIYNKILKKYGLKMAESFYNSQEEGIECYEKLIKKYNIECNFERKDGYIYTNLRPNKLREEYEVLLRIGAEPIFLNKIDNFPLPLTGAIKQKRQAQFEPLNFLSSLPVDYKIYEHSRIIDIDFKANIAFTKSNFIKYKKIIIATNYPIMKLKGYFFAKEYKSMSYAVAFKNLNMIDGIFNDDREDGITIRSFRDKFIIGGLDHRTGRKQKFNHFDKLEEIAKNISKDSKPTNYWVSEDCVTFDDIAFIGRINRNENDKFVITGFNKWGMANSIIGAKLICDLVLGKENKYEKVFSPQRSYIFNNMGNIMKGAMFSFGNLFKSYLTFPIKNLKKLNKDDGKIFMLSGKKCAVYKDLNENLFIIPARCRHMGCELSFNPEAKSWDCACHGSRYDIYGDILNEPTVKKLV